MITTMYEMLTFFCSLPQLVLTDLNVTLLHVAFVYNYTEEFIFESHTSNQEYSYGI